MRIVTVPCLRDNYAYLVISASGLAAVVDPGEAAPVLAEIARQGVQLRQVWATHHHADHVGGVPALRAALPALEVVAHAIDAPRIGPSSTRCRMARGWRSGAGGRGAAQSRAHAGRVHVPGRRRGVHRRHAVRRRLRPAVRG
jgi:glyoxylase-like metal-dependent hydrolase (beta-lactamase superfamily II)